MHNRTHPKPPRPELYSIPGWQYVPIDRVVVADKILTSVAKVNRGQIPAEASEDTLQAFLNEAAIPSFAADIEPALVFPHRTHISRPVAQAAYRDFVLWCLANGWAAPEPEAVSGTVKNMGRAPADQPVAEDEPKRKSAPKKAKADSAPSAPPATAPSVPSLA